jgi:AAA+ ATPase superfamily predicted ATPase
MFIGRETELNELNKEYNKAGFRFVVIYGRRRVGKTSLITQFLAGKKAIFYIAIEQNDKSALESFSEKVLEVFPSAKSMIDVFPSWEKAFTYIAEESKGNRIILAIDEYPYLVNSNNSLSSLLQKLIDTTFKDSHLFLLLCGSSMSFMENQIMGYQSPLYGRRTAQFKLEAFDFFDSTLFFPQFSLEDKMLAYATFGGIPQYLNYIRESKDIYEAIYENFFTKTGPLYEEPENLLKQELREPAIYNTIISAIAKGSSRLNEIATNSGEDSKKCAKYLKSLISLQIIEKEYPIGRETERNCIYNLRDNMARRNCRYKLRDNMFRFWYRFIPQYTMNIESLMGQQILEHQVMPDLNHFIGPIFEEVCEQYLIRKNMAWRSCRYKLQDNILSFLPFPFFKIGRWWGANPATKTQIEIDIIATGENKTFFGECKWTKEPIGCKVLEDLKIKSAILKQYPNQYFILFSKSGFTDQLIGLAKNDDRVELINYDSSFLAFHN